MHPRLEGAQGSVCEGSFGAASVNSEVVDDDSSPLRIREVIKQRWYREESPFDGTGIGYKRNSRADTIKETARLFLLVKSE